MNSKLPALGLLAIFLQLGVIANAQKISLSEKKASLEKIFHSIEKQSGYLFWYEYSLLDHTSKVTIHCKEVSVPEALDLCLQGQPLQYNIVHTTVVISKKEGNNPATVTANLPAEIEGTVTDSAGSPLEGVSVFVPRGGMGVSTDAAGRFRLAAPTGSEMHFSLVSYEPLDTSFQINGGINVVMRPARSSMSDVVVVGYGSLSKRNVSGSISSVSVQSIQNQHPASFVEAIEGQAAGVQVSQLTGTPGGGAIIRVRGTGSISASNEPLYVIDGFPIEGSYNRDLNPLATINPSDIESIQILKDASAVAIYGSRGSNGVVIVNTKRGHGQKPLVQFDTYYGVQQVAHKIDMLDAAEYAAYDTEARNNAWTDLGGNAFDPDSVRPDRLKIPPMFRDASSLGKGTDWQSEIFRSAPVRSYNVSVSNGKEDTHYLLSAGYFDQCGVVMNTGFKRYSVRFNFDSKLSDRIKIGFNIAPSYIKNDVLPVDDQIFGGGILGAALAMPPTVPVYNPDGSYATMLKTSGYNTGVINNPVAIANKLKEGTSAFRTLGSLFAEWEILKGLQFRSSAGADYNEDRFNFYWPSDLGRGGSAAPVISEGKASESRTFVWLIENTLTWNKAIGNRHFINAVAGVTSQRSITQGASLDAVFFPTDEITTINPGQTASGTTDITEWSLYSQFARINYNYRSKYLFTATIRRDGSSRFGPDNKWGTFPSASAGWNISKEHFMSGIHAISDLKLRISYGNAGNNEIGDYNYLGLVNYNQYVFGAGSGGAADGLQPVTLANPGLSWEVMRQLDLGADLALWKDRVNLTVDYFDRTTSNLLLNVPIPGSLGFSTLLKNIGRVSNKGWDFSASSNNLIHAFQWKTSLNFSFNRNKVLELGPNKDPIIASSNSFNAQTHITAIGQSIGNFYGYQLIGVYRDQADLDNSAKVMGSGGSRPGDLKFKDVNGDGVITALDMTTIGHNDPDFIYGLNNDFSFRNFALGIMIDGVHGAQVLNGSRKNIQLSTGAYSRRDVLGRWQSPEEPGDGKTPRADVAATGGSASFVSSLLVEDASFLRVRNINLRYSIPKKLLERKFISSISVFVSVQNAFMITRYQGYNPEQNLNGSDALTRGTDYNGYPLAKVFGGGLNVTFQ